jgi:ABC-type xylose transport system permease subunit
MCKHTETQNIKAWLVSLAIVTAAGLVNGMIGVTVLNRTLQGETGSHSLGLRTCAVLVQVIGVSWGSIFLSRRMPLQLFFAVMAGLLLFTTRGSMLALFWEPGDRPVTADFFQLKAAAVLLAFSFGVTAVCVAATYVFPVLRWKPKPTAQEGTVEKAK